MLIYTPDNLHLHATHTPYSTPTTLDAEDTHSHTSADSFPCPTPEPIPHTNTNPIPILPRLATDHPVGRLPPDSQAHEQPSPPLPDPLLLQEAKEAKEAQADTRAEVPSGAADTNGSANEWEDANQGVTWADYGLPPAKGFVLNDGLDYVPFDICLPKGDYKPAKYIKIEWGKDPLVYGMIDGDPHQYVESFQAAPMPSVSPLHTYTPTQLEFFKENHDLRPEVDEAAHRLYDKGVLAEMECYRRNKVALERDLREECYVFTLTRLHHKQHYYRTASFLYRDPTSPHSCEVQSGGAPSTIQGLVSLYIPIGDPRTLITVRLYRYLVRYHLSTNTY